MMMINIKDIDVNYIQYGSGKKISYYYMVGDKILK